MSENKAYAYAVVRADIPTGYQIVQTAHAVAEHEKQFHDSMAGQTMVVLSVPNETLLVLLCNHLVSEGADVTMFWEPDVAEYTAFAVSPGEYPAFRGMKLAGLQ